MTDNSNDIGQTLELPMSLGDVISNEHKKSKHLIFVQHGLFGCSYFFDGFKQRIENSVQNSTVILPSINNFLLSTFGMKTCGIKLVKVVEESILQYPDATTISFISHSFGGILTRYVIGLLHERGIFDKIKPFAFVAISSPHLGVITDSTIIQLGLKHFTGKTGKDLMIDSSSLKEISCAGSKYIVALDDFKVKLLYGNLYNDTVSCESACICEDVSRRNLTELVPKRLFLINETNLRYHEENDNDCNPLTKDCYLALKKINWIKKVIDLSEYYNSHITIVGRHTFIPFLEVGKSEGYMIVDDIIKEMNKSLQL